MKLFTLNHVVVQELVFKSIYSFTCVQVRVKNAKVESSLKAKVASILMASAVATQWGGGGGGDCFSIRHLLRTWRSLFRFTTDLFDKFIHIKSMFQFTFFIKKDWHYLQIKRTASILPPRFARFGKYSR